MWRSIVPTVPPSAGAIPTFAAILLLTCASAAFAGAGVDVNWGSACWSDGTPLGDLAFPCDTNSGRAVMTCSFAVSFAQTNFAGVEISLDGMSAACSVPAWWQMGSGECRSSALSATADFLEAPQVGCVDVWQNHAWGGIGSYLDGASAGDPRRTHLRIGYALQPEATVPLQADVEYYAASVRIAYSGTMGAGSCSGCLHPFAWVLSSIKAAGLTGYEMLYEPLPGGNQCLLWQHARFTCNWGWWDADCLTPARNPTWGQIKSLYR